MKFRKGVLLMSFMIPSVEFVHNFIISALIFAKNPEPILKGQMLFDISVENVLIIFWQMLAGKF